MSTACADCDVGRTGWKSSNGFTCAHYKSKKWCEDGTYGSGWGAQLGTFEKYSVNGVDASQACCACGKACMMTAENHFSQDTTPLMKDARGQTIRKSVDSCWECNERCAATQGCGSWVVDTSTNPGGTCESNFRNAWCELYAGAGKFKQQVFDNTRILGLTSPTCVPPTSAHAPAPTPFTPTGTLTRSPTPTPTRTPTRIPTPPTPVSANERRRRTYYYEIRRRRTWYERRRRRTYYDIRRRRTYYSTLLDRRRAPPNRRLQAVLLPLCDNCTAGRFQDEEGQGGCKDCPAGKYQREAGQAQCRLCTEATYRAARDPGTICMACGLLDNGRRPVTYGTGKKNESDCVEPRQVNAECPPGKESTSPDAESCRNCTAGRYKSTSDEMPCRRCDCGRFSRTGATSCDAVCKPGTFGNSGSGMCEPCPDAHFCVASLKKSVSKAAQCVPGEHVFSEVTISSDRACANCTAGQFSAMLNAASCSICPGGKYQDSPGRSYCDTCGEGFVCDILPSGVARIETCPPGFSCSGKSKDFCDDKISDPATGKCVSCEDKEFANTRTNTCVQCPRLQLDEEQLDPGQKLDSPLALGIECLKGTIRVKDGFYVVPGAGGKASLGNHTVLVPCRGESGVCSTDIADDFSARTVCNSNAAGPLCGACEPGFARRTPRGACEACNGGWLALCVLLAALLVFGFMYRQCIKFALRNALRGKKSEFMTFSVLKIAMAFLFNTSLLSSYQLDWGTLLASLFKANSIASSGDPTSVAQAQCIGLDLHTKMKLLVAAPFAAMLLPLPFLIKAKYVSRSVPRAAAPTVFGVAPRDAYWSAVLIGWWLLHPAVLSQAVSALLTLSVGGKEYALADLSIEATGAAYERTQALAIFLLSSFVVGLPVYVFARLYRWRGFLKVETEAGNIPGAERIRLFYFYGSYDSKRFYWELVVFAVRTGMVATSSVSAASLDRQTQQQLIFVTTWIALVHFMLVYKFTPYSRKVESRVNKVVQFVLLALLLCALGLSADDRGSFATVLRFFCGLMVLGTLAVFLLVFMQQSRSKLQQKKDFAPADGKGTQRKLDREEDDRFDVHDEFSERESGFTVEMNPLAAKFHMSQANMGNKKKGKSGPQKGRKDSQLVESSASAHGRKQSTL